MITMEYYGDLTTLVKTILVEEVERAEEFFPEFYDGPALVMANVEEWFCEILENAYEMKQTIVRDAILRSIEWDEVYCHIKEMEADWECDKEEEE